jgi:ribosomal protein S18 acetylase RimI-like enzyme
MTTFAVRRAQAADVERLVPLFDAYRAFYEQPRDLEMSSAFLRERVERDESVVFVADSGGEMLGFVQLYPVWSSTTTPPGRLWLLNDLFVAETARRRGAGRALMERAERFAVETGAVGITLSTGIGNLRAHKLYESIGYRRDTKFFTYSRTLI